MSTQAYEDLRGAITDAIFAAEQIDDEWLIEKLREIEEYASEEWSERDAEI